MEDIEKYITPAEKEFLRLNRWLQNMMREWEKKHRPLNDKERDFLQRQNNMEQTILQDAEDRRDRAKREEKQEEKRLKKVNISCEKCRKTSRSRVIGTRKNPLGHTVRKLYCSRCKVVYYDPIPIDHEEALAWCDNFHRKLTQTLEGKTKEDKALAEELQISPEELESEKKAMLVFRNAVLEKRESCQRAKKAEQKVQETIEEMNAVLLKFQLSRTNWNKHIGKA